MIIIHIPNYNPPQKKYRCYFSFYAKTYVFECKIGAPSEARTEAYLNTLKEHWSWQADLVPSAQL
jgi:hypothetical protein